MWEKQEALGENHMTTEEHATSTHLALEGSSISCSHVPSVQEAIRVRYKTLRGLDKYIISLSLHQYLLQ